MVATQLRNTSITAFTTQGVGQGGAARHAVIMDEVDGMSGNEDRGGMQVGGGAGEGDKQVGGGAGEGDRQVGGGAGEGERWVSNA